MAKVWKPCLWAVLLLSGLVLGDVVKLKDGSSFEGTVLEEDDQHVKLQMLHATRSFNRTDVAEVVHQKSNLQERDERLEKLVPWDAAAYFDLGKWCITDLQDDGNGVHLITLAMALDEKLYAPAQLYLGDYYAKKDKRKAAACYLAALLADPTNADANDRYGRVKDLLATQSSGSDKRLLEGLTALTGGQWDPAIEALESGRGSRLRARCEKMLGAQIEDLIVYCHSMVPCKSCGGSGQMPCPDCKGNKLFTCPQCQGKGFTVAQAVKGRTPHICATCQGWGDVLCTKCSPPPQRIAQPIAYPPGAWLMQGQIMVGGSSSLPFVVTDPGPPVSERIIRPGFNIQGGGTVPCRFCGRGSQKPVVHPDPNALAACADFLQRQISGTLSLVEQADSRMQRVGGAGQVEGAQELLARPVWFKGKSGQGGWLSLDDRKKIDPDFKPPTKSGSGGPRVNPQQVRKDAVALDPEGSEWARFEERARQACGIGGAPVKAGQILRTDFGTTAPAAEAGAGPYMEAGSDGKLKPCLVQVCETFSTRRIRLESAGGKGLAIGSSTDLAAAARGKMRVYYSVVDAREEIAPSGSRDVATTHLTVKPVLIDILDAAGNIKGSIQ